MNNIAIFGNRHQEGNLHDLQKFFVILDSREFRVSIHSRFAAYLNENGVTFGPGVVMTDEFPEAAECVISIGGDGTFLRAAQWVANREIPILGINTGHLGFLASYSLDETEELLSTIAGGMGCIERRALLEVKGDCVPDGFWSYALNEVAVLKAETASMVTVRAEIDGRFLADYLSDGLVISTPTGSTAYNLSVGGPILQPTLGCLVLSPIAPHSLTMRPLVVGGASDIVLSAYSRSKYARVSLDGRSFMMRCGGEDSIRITRAPFSVMLLRRPESTFSDLLRTKLLWGQR